MPFSKILHTKNSYIGGNNLTEYNQNLVVMAYALIIIAAILICWLYVYHKRIDYLEKGFKDLEEKITEIENERQTERILSKEYH